MKMETVIRSPQKGVIKRLAHKEGVCLLLRGGLKQPYTDLTQDICKAGTTLVIFEDAEAGEPAQ